MPQSGKYLLDTNIVIAMFAGEVVIQERRQNADRVFLPSLFDSRHARCTF